MKTLTQMRAASELLSVPNDGAARNKAPTHSTHGLPGTQRGWVPYHGAVARACRAYLRTDSRGRVMDADLANLAAVFIAACYRWQGHSTRNGGGWFTKTDAQWCDELCVHKERLWDVLRFVCIDDQTSAVLGAPSIGIVRRRAGRQHLASAYLVDSERAGAWWLASGRQPALAAAPEAVDKLGTTPGTTESSCQRSLTTSCQRSLTHHTNIFGGGGKKESESAPAHLSRDDAERLLVQLFGNRWANALDRAVPIAPATSEQELIRDQLRTQMRDWLSGEVEQYLRDVWGIADEGVLWEVGATAAVMGFDVRLIREHVGDKVLADNVGRTMRNPTGVFVHRWRTKAGGWFNAALRAQGYIAANAAQEVTR